MRKLSIGGAKNRAALTTAIICLSRGSSAQTNLDFVQQIAEGGLELSPLWLMQTESSENASTIFKQSPSTEESNWMSMIDLIQRTELQLDPVLDLQNDFDSATEAFFGVLEEAEAQDSDAKVQDSAKLLRNAINEYEEACEQIMESFGTLMKERKTQETLAIQSLQVTTKANTNTKEKKEKAKKTKAEDKSNDDDDKDEDEDPVILEAAQTKAIQEDNAEKTTDEEAGDTSKDSKDSEEVDEEQPEKTESDKNDKDGESKEEKDAEKAPKVDTSSPLGQLVVELRMLAELADGDLVSVCYGSDEGMIF